MNDARRRAVCIANKSERQYWINAGSRSGATTDTDTNTDTNTPAVVQLQMRFDEGRCCSDCCRGIAEC